MRKIIICTFICLLLTGCSSGVSQEEYDRMISINKDLLSNYSELDIKHQGLNADYNNMFNEYQQIQDKYDELLSAYDDSADRLMDMTTKYTDLLATTGEDVVIEAWGNVAFGDNVKYSVMDSSTIQYIYSIESVKENNIILSFKSVTDNISTLQAVTSSKDIDYVYIKILDNNFYPVYELFIDFSGDEVKTDMLTNAIYNDLIATALEQL